MITQLGHLPAAGDAITLVLPSSPGNDDAPPTTLDATVRTVTYRVPDRIALRWSNTPSDPPRISGDGGHR